MDQRIAGDSTHVNQWLLGASFPVDAETMSLIYDPQTTFITNIDPTTNMGDGGDDNGNGEFLVYILILILGVACVSTLLIIKKKHKKVPDD
ncbi:MAG: hypothetical protein GF364_22190 [Candidatus Lokiarchaeota archaeon]|nr:hypothetical protein [Candidatus Lokiarchaeota archaeon]